MTSTGGRRFVAFCQAEATGQSMLIERSGMVQTPVDQATSSTETHSPDEHSAARLVPHAETYLANAEKAGVPLEPELIEAIKSALDAYARNVWTKDIENRFSPAYDKLRRRIESINASGPRIDVAGKEPDADPPTFGEMLVDGSDDTVRVMLRNAEMLLGHAAQAGLDLKPELIDAIETARAKFGIQPWTEIAKRFWPAYAQLCTLVKPVTALTLKASTGPELKDVLLRYRRGAIWLMIILVPLSVVMFIDTSISNEIGDNIRDANGNVIKLHNDLITLSQVTDQHAAAQAHNASSVQTDPQSNDRDTILTRLQEFAAANRLLYSRANLLNHFVLNFEPDPFSSMSEQDRNDKFELPVPVTDIPKAGTDKIRTYQMIRSYAKNVQQINLLFYGAITAYILPILYALLGAHAYALRSLSEQTITKTFSPSYAPVARLIIALIAGLVVGLFNNFTQGISLSPLAIAFLVGYAVEIFFSFLDAFLDTLKKVRA